MLKVAILNKSFGRLWLYVKSSSKTIKHLKSLINVCYILFGKVLAYPQSVSTSTAFGVFGLICKFSKDCDFPRNLHVSLFLKCECKIRKNRWAPCREIKYVHISYMKQPSGNLLYNSCLCWPNLGELVFDLNQVFRHG